MADEVLRQLQSDFPSAEERENDDVFGETTTSKTQDDEKEEELPEALKNRHIRRLEAKLDRERESNIQLAAREAARSEYEKFAEKTKGLTVDERLLTLYGDNENGRKAAALTQSLLEDVAKRTKEETLSEIESSRQDSSRQVEVEKNTIETNLESIEDTYNVDLSGSSERSAGIRNAFLEFVEKLSPKDSEGNIEEYADFESSWELFQERIQKSNSRQKDLGSRGLTRSTGTTTDNTQDKLAQDFLRREGII